MNLTACPSRVWVRLRNVWMVGNKGIDQPCTIQTMNAHWFRNGQWSGHGMQRSKHGVVCGQAQVPIMLNMHHVCVCDRSLVSTFCHYGRFLCLFCKRHRKQKKSLRGTVGSLATNNPKQSKTKIQTHAKKTKAKTKAKTKKNTVVCTMTKQRCLPVTSFFRFLA